MHYSMKRYHSLGMLCALCTSLFLFSCKKEIPVTSISLDRTDVVLDQGQTGSLTATLEPAEATENAVSWTSSATDIVTVTADGTSATIKAVKGGTATISVTCGGKSASCEVAVVPEGAVDLGMVMKRGDGTTYHLFWAKTNLSEDGFCAKPEDAGDYFAWGETEPYYKKGHALDDPCSNWRKDESGYDWASYKFMSKGLLTRYCVTERPEDFWGEGEPDNKTRFSDYDYVDDAARTILGGKWRTPSPEEWGQLLEQCTMTYTDDYKGTGMAGSIFTGKKEGYTDKSIFLPAVGHRARLNVYQYQKRSSYMSSQCTENESLSNYAVFLDARHGISWRYAYLRSQGLPVRAVWE